MESSSAGVVSADSKVSDVVGPTLNLDIAVESVLVSSLLDNGSPSTFGKPLPTVKAFGKDGKLGKKELNITA